MMRTILSSIAIVALSLFAFQSAKANNVVVSNITLTGQNVANDFTFVQFNITWENSWRDDGNRDAAWVFVKFSINSGASWDHATLYTTGHTTPTGATIDTPADGKGIFIYRNANGSGTNTWDGVELKWDYGSDGVSDNAAVVVKVIAIEMVYIPQAAFAAGSGGSEASAFTLTTINTANATTIPSGVGSLGGKAGGHPEGQTAPDNASWPNGFNAFYMMKYEITQEQYKDFLNCLTYDQQNTRTTSEPDGSDGAVALCNSLPCTNSNRNGIQIQVPGFAEASPAVYANNLDGDANFNEANDGQNIACNFLGWLDGAAYADWAALRPMTELEFEKACRGDQPPLVNEFAWGTANITISEIFTLANPGAANEDIATNYATTLGIGNAHAPTSNLGIDGPLRAGIFAGNALNTTDERVRSGAGFYGNMELSGNLNERVVTIGNSTGRLFTGTVGNGALSAAGNATNSDWPIAGVVTTNFFIGIGLRGGCYDENRITARVSDRQDAANSESGGRQTRNGFRAVRGVL